MSQQGKWKTRSLLDFYT